MSTLDDLRRTLAEHATAAPDAPGLVMVAEVGAARIRLRRRVAAITATAVAVVILIVSVPAVVRLQAGPKTPATRPPGADRRPYELTLSLDPSYRVSSVRRSAQPTRQGLFVERHTGTKVTFRADVFAYGPGAYVPSPAAGVPVEAVTVRGRPARYTPMVAVSNNGFRPPAVTWTDPGGVPIRVSSSGEVTKGALLALAEAVRVGTPQPMSMPFRLGRLPDGLRLAGGDDYDTTPGDQRRPLGAMVHFDRPPLVERSLLTVAAVVEVPLPGTPVAPVAGHPATWLVRDGAAALYVQVGECWYEFRTPTSDFTQAQLRSLAESTTYKDCTDRSTWVPLVE